MPLFVQHGVFAQIFTKFSSKKNTEEFGKDFRLILKKYVYDQNMASNSNFRPIFCLWP
jgi:hypothetical protein